MAAASISSPLPPRCTSLQMVFTGNKKKNSVCSVLRPPRRSMKLRVLLANRRFAFYSTAAKWPSPVPCKTLSMCCAGVFCEAKAAPGPLYGPRLHQFLSFSRPALMLILILCTSPPLQARPEPRHAALHPCRIKPSCVFAPGQGAGSHQDAAGTLGRYR